MCEIVPNWSPLKDMFKQNKYGEYTCPKPTQWITTTTTPIEQNPYTCPVCKGVGMVDCNFYPDTGISSELHTECRSCGGKGIVWG